MPEIVDAPEMYRGDGWWWPLEFYSDAALSIPVDLTGYGTVWAAQARGIRNTVIDLAVDSSEAAAGRLLLFVSHTVTGPLQPSSLAYDLQVTAPSGEPTTLIRGAIRVSGDETRP